MDVSNAVNRACLLLLSAHLEGFVEDVVTESLDELVSQRAVVDDLPLLLRALHVEDHLRVLEPMKDRNARAPRIQRLFDAEVLLWTSGTQLERTMVRIKTVCGQMSNPGSTELRHFLELMGVDLASFLDSEGEMALLGQVDGLVARRNAIAHGDPTGATSQEIYEYIIAVESMARMIDAALAQSLQGICRSSTLPW
jgi:hypothetical protein